MMYGFRTYKTHCPFCEKLNEVWDGTGDSILDKTCSHYKWVCQGYKKPDMVFQKGKSQKSGVDYIFD